MRSKAENIEKIIEIEWEMFQKVNNIGGRASCQDDFHTFYIMRRAQYESWSAEMVNFYLEFAEKCREDGRNLVEEKYARMMQYTDMHYFNQHIKGRIPEIPEQNYPIINRIVKVLVEWEKDFAKKYPKLAGRGRPVTSEGDKTGFTSMETYARGELETYPRQFLSLYEDYIKKIAEEGRSLSLINQEIMVGLYGYDSIEAAEASIAR